MRNDNKIGKLYGVGIGPGDPTLLTLKAKDALEKADIIFAPKGSDEGISVARRIIEQVIEGKKTYIELTFPMTKDKNLLKKYWKKAGQRIAGELKKGKQSAFVTLGDPFIYSTYIYLLRIIKQDYPKIEVETIPGISAFNAAASRAGFSLLEGKEKMAVLPVNETMDGIEDALKDFDTVVLMKVGAKLQKVIRLLKQKGLAKNAVLISRVGHPNEKIIRNIANIKDKELGYLSVILVKTKAG
ncbi:MAG: precorrin-2 C(20)-methyltransferase [Omnitrophica WOR_2 bacterium GWF2_43_52]|nr:MAG: precorrin-2 C(20)-methyltransferase [Omnitrophica WOR_2 bacterium GWC2_44_8]OGX22390.1 MAG: precorrin-2 C(20)-methyltransferase [Omnitrophica WOR_2 bacterium GWF2_43_52]OGX57873.1 MAG: precorrin-2 C(20)-methyltransferase [Omnitrophica WOR_2 bacterium RIFOXYC2_FULL_43_9]HAH20806.1 precorrin-2 C(20)-methyltransferase [Candidatus Omnitrophota bacterium]HBG64474.1 precorrin-2 C(20)-methyltransferase [Candidatus Omnitrophota bacterium]